MDDKTVADLFYHFSLLVATGDGLWYNMGINEHAEKDEANVQTYRYFGWAPCCL